MPTLSLNNQKGSIAIMLVSLVLLSVFIYSMLAILQNSRQQVENVARFEARKGLIDRNLALLRNEFIINYSLSKFNSAALNPNLKTCVMDSTITASCTNINIAFYQPNGLLDEKFAGGTSRPMYNDLQGRPCLDNSNQPTSSCAFKIVSNCAFTCPNNQSTCPLVKTMSCDLEISRYGLSNFKTFLFSEKNTAFAASYSLRISNDLLSFYAIK